MPVRNEGRKKAISLYYTMISGEKDRPAGRRGVAATAKRVVKTDMNQVRQKVVGWVKVAQAYGGSSQTDQPVRSDLSRSNRLTSDRRPTRVSPTKLRSVPVDATLQFMNNPA